MKKIKKIFISLVAFIVAGFTKIGRLVSKGFFSPQDIYGVPDPPEVPSPNIKEVALNIMVIIVKYSGFVLVFLVGLFVVLNKKTTKKRKSNNNCSFCYNSNSSICSYE